MSFFLYAIIKDFYPCYAGTTNLTIHSNGDITENP